MKSIKNFSSMELMCILSAIILTSCGPYKTPKWKDIGANETAFLIPLQNGTKDGQEALKSVDYLEKKKVASKRVYIEQIEISTGRAWYDYEYIPTDTLVYSTSCTSNS